MVSLRGVEFHSHFDRLDQFVLWPDRQSVPAEPTVERRHYFLEERQLTYRFFTHYHPFAGELVERLIEGSIQGLQATDTDYDLEAPALPDGRPRPRLYAPILTNGSYTPAGNVVQPYPVRDLDFTPGGSYAVYNWELFFHVPLTLAIHLSRSGRYEQAQRWFHYIFDPTDDGEGPEPDRFWKVRPFQATNVQLAEALMINLATGKDPELRAATIASIEAWQNSPFRPHVLARFRPSAYMVKTVTAYLDNLIAWGDSLFRQDTRESINEATQVYVLAALILGPRPQQVPTRGSMRPQTYAQLRPHLDAFNNALRDLEADIVFNVTPFPSTPPTAGGGLVAIESLGQSLYFCIPRNDRLLGYWDTVADRLFKIRNSLNIQGIFRQLPLFEPPIDPALLARAAAAGLDIAAVIAGINQPLPLVRFQSLVQKALEICREVQALGAALLSAMEKEDNEALQILRAKHERVILGLGETVRYGQHQEAIKAREALEKTLDAAVVRYRHYEQLLGRKAEEIAPPQLDPLDLQALDALRLRVEEPAIDLRQVEFDIATDLGDDLAGRILSSHEKTELDKLEDARGDVATATGYEKIAGGAAILATFGTHMQPLGTGTSLTFGGSNLASAASFTASFYRSWAEEDTYDAGRAARIGSYARREQEWAHQSNLAVGEINQVVKQLRAAQIREAIAERELRNHRQQMDHAARIEEFLADETKGKKTGQALYAWMKRETRGLYGQVFQFAYDVARKAERALQHELGDTSVSFLNYGYMGGREGLLAGEKLLFDVRRMEIAYHDLNTRELELTRHVSLLQLDPMALLRLRRTGNCTVRVPEELFDLDGAGHYFRRMKLVAVSIPCVVGPYASLRCTLTLVRSSIRTQPQLLDNGADDPYERDGENDERFSDYLGSLQSIVTSTGQNDSGLFEANLRDERYLPFENSGVISEWQIDLPKEFREFDYDTIADLILHFRFTARQGGESLRRAAEQNLLKKIAEARAAGTVRLFSLRHEFPTEWARFKSQTATEEAPFLELRLPLAEEHYPFWTRGRVQGVEAVDLLVLPSEPRTTLAVARTANPPDDAAKDVLRPEMAGLLGARLKAETLASAFAPDPVSLFFESNELKDAWLAVAWSSAEA